MFNIFKPRTFSTSKDKSWELLVTQPYFSLKLKPIFDEYFLLLRLRGLISNKWALLSYDHKYRCYFLRTAYPQGGWDMVEAVNLMLNLNFPGK